MAPFGMVRDADERAAVLAAAGETAWVEAAVIDG
jgi:hypothetical protein